MAEATACRTSEAIYSRPLFARRNYILGVANGSLAQLGNGIIHPELVLAAYIYWLTDSALLVGLVATLTHFGTFLPQLYIGNIMESYPRKKPFYVVSFLFRVLGLLVMVSSIWASSRLSPAIALTSFFIGYLVYRLALGCGTPAFMDIIGKTIGPGRLGSFFAFRSFFGTGTAVVAGFLLVQPLLQRIDPPYSFALLGAIATVVMSIGWGAFSLSHEEHNKKPPERRPLRETFVEGLKLLKESRNYRLILTIKSLVRCNILLQAFYIPYAAERMGVRGLEGVFIGFVMASKLLSSLIWGRVSDKRGNKACLIGSAFCFVAAAALAIIAPRLPVAFSWNIPQTGVALTFPLAIYLLALCMFGMGLTAHAVSLNSFLLESAPPDRRPTYFAFILTMCFPMTMLPLLAGMLVDNSIIALDTLFVIIFFSGVATLIASIRLEEVRDEEPSEESPEGAEL